MFNVTGSNDGVMNGDDNLVILRQRNGADSKVMRLQVTQKRGNLAGGKIKERLLQIEATGLADLLHPSDPCILFR
jgi:hypothetical protein